MMKLWSWGVPILTACAALMPLSVEAQVADESAASARRTFVIVHGAWGGSWAFREVESLLRSRGHTVYRPSLTGLGERVHLATADIDLSTHVMDVVNVFRYEELNDVVLVGHSYGGMVISGVADRIPERIGQIIYLDAFLPESGESVYTARGPGEPATAAWERDGFVVPPWLQPDRPPPSDVPHPARTFAEPLVLENEAARRIPAAYILTVDPGATTDAFDFFADRATAKGWTVEVMEADHNPQWSAPRPLVDLLLSVEGRPTLP